MSCIVLFDEHRALLRLYGGEDRASCGLRRRALSRALRATRDVVADLSELEHADTSLLLDLAVLAQRLRAGGRRLLIRGAQPQVRRMVEAMGLTHLPGVVVDPAGGVHARG